MTCINCLHLIQHRDTQAQTIERLRALNGQKENTIARLKIGQERLRALLKPEDRPTDWEAQVRAAMDEMEAEDG